ncbi:RagB/SusD family nutrient uptake outer membrane protein [Bacteroides sp. 51]|uniref:RagB/SusD family nutrient uptake outer membrane protein n=1 Tax=Bacteroides sp. 51 TaxID=2302938 RepID=UPI0013D34381|nr:RagB/SusD family nutrient uptake outer membrane protein [Bacteroides sp. 51]NDV83022.1 RagB/SusD family nutrient uptake outer membrane protein [Bacteroides sp. 51]
MKIFKTLYVATVCMTMMIAASSCVNNWLDQSPTDGVEAETAIKNSADLANVRVGLYAAVKGNSDLVNYYARQMFVYGDMRGEDIQYEHKAGSNRASFYYYMDYTTEDNFTRTTAVWQVPYIVIARANRLIQAVESGDLTDKEEAKDIINQYDAEARVLRAMALFDLTRIYGKPYTQDQGASLGVPIATSTLESTAKPNRSTVAKCYETIEDDLTTAINSGSLVTKTSVGYINLWAAKALLVRVYLTKGEWGKALSTAEEIIQGSPYKLWSRSEYVSAWNKSNAQHTNELLFEIPINDKTDWTDREGIAYIYADKDGTSPGYGDVIVTKDFSNMLTSDPLDIRNDILLAPGDKQSTYAGNKVYINKMPPVDGDVRYANVPLLRLSEVYLSAAEAAFQAGDKIKATSLLNSIISNRTSDANKLVTKDNVTLERIYIERRKELVGEGQRYFDVIRRDETVVRYTDTNNRGWHDILSEDARTFNRNSKKVLPLIPVGEINANPNIEQNPAY